MKIAREFEDPQVQQSWDKQMVMYGPLLRPAFAGNISARLTLLEVLEQLEQDRNLDAAENLRSLREICRSPGDYAAVYVLMGICLEQCGREQEASECYERATLCRHKYFYPYMRLADWYEQTGELELCAENTRRAMDCLADSADDPYFRKVLAKLAYNLGFCGLMMHRPEEARQAMAYSEALNPHMPARIEGWAMLEAVSGNREELERRLREAEAEFPERAALIREQTQAILRGEDPYFTVQPVNGPALEAFWDWVWVNRQTLLEQLAHKESRRAFYRHVSQHLQPVMPFTQYPIHFVAHPEEGRVLVFMEDCYNRSVHGAMEAVIAACPASLQPYLDFTLGG